MSGVPSFTAPISARSARVHRVVVPFEDRTGLVRMDRNEDVSGWDDAHLGQMLSRIQSTDLAAYHDADPFQEQLAGFLGVPRESLTITSGSSEAVQMVFETYLDENTTVLALEPSYGLYEVFAAKCGAELLGFPYSDDLTLDVDGLITRIADVTPRLVVIANPNQPTGTVITEDDLRRIATAALGVGAVLLVDEAYFLFTPISAVGLISQFPNVVITQTFSKAFGLAGLRLGYCVGPVERIREIEKLRALTQSNAFALAVAAYVLDHEQWALARVSDVIAGRDFLVDRFVTAGLVSFPSHANFVLLGCSSSEAARKLVSQARGLGFALRGPISAPPLTNFVRVTAGPLALMEEFWAQAGSLILELATRREG
ncbi:MAG: histidinol-phosphate aminotransferase [Actinomycetota bacterium]|jgi:histidinol-phosphate aminotransferase|nr:histidinol-phosphate aminotransferase [Actinomycetota bacterium]